MARKPLERSFGLEAIGVVREAQNNERICGFRATRRYSLLEVLNVKLACVPGRIRPEVRLPLDQRILCSDCCEKCIMVRPGSLLIFCTA